MTFVEMVAESKVFEHSAEYYNFQKECAELEMMGIYLDNQEFVNNNRSLVESSQATFGGSYFMESATDADYQELTEAFGEKIKEGANWIWNRIKTLWNAICGWVQKMFIFVQGTDGKFKSWAEWFNKNWNKIDGKEGSIPDGEDNSKEVNRNNVIYDTMVAVSKNVGISFAANAETYLDKDVYDDVPNFAPLYTNTFAKEYMVIETNGAADIDQIPKIGQFLIDSYSNDSAKSLLGRIEKSKFVKVPVSVKKLEKSIKDLEAIRTKISQASGANLAAAETNTGKANSLKAAGENYNRAFIVLSNTIAAYNKAVTYRTQVAKQLERAFNSLGKIEKASKSK